ncbi:MAG: hypothetical protein AB7F75_13090 [Planctomycetota bacterium]
MKTAEIDKRVGASIAKVHADITVMTTLIKNWADKHSREATSWAMFGDLNGVRENLVEILVRVTYDGNSEETTKAKLLEALGK